MPSPLKWGGHPSGIILNVGPNEIHMPLFGQGTRMTMRKTLEETERRINETRNKLEKLRKRRARELRCREERREEFAFRKADLSKDLASAHQETSLYEYADAMTAARGESNVESTYIVALEAQLCRAVHLMGALNKQLRIVKGTNEAIARKMEHDVANQTNEKSLVELRLMNEMVQLDIEKRSIEEHYDKKLEEQGREIARLRPVNYEGGFVKGGKLDFYDDIAEREARLSDFFDPKGHACESDHVSECDSKVSLASVTEPKLDSKAATTA